MVASAAGATPTAGDGASRSADGRDEKELDERPLGETAAGAARLGGGGERRPPSGGDGEREWALPAAGAGEWRPVWSREPAADGVDAADHGARRGVPPLLLASDGDRECDCTLQTSAPQSAASAAASAAAFAADRGSRRPRNHPTVGGGEALSGDASAW